MFNYLYNYFIVKKQFYSKQYVPIYLRNYFIFLFKFVNFNCCCSQLAGWGCVRMDQTTTIDNIKYLVKKLTCSGKDSLNQELIKNLKKICKQSDLYVLKLHQCLFEQFKRRHAEVRLSCFLICDEIFCRSHCFRCLVLKDITILLDLVFGSDLKKGELEPLPAARKLKTLAIRSIKKWHEKYGSAYNALPLAINYMINCRNVDFELNTNMSRVEKEKAEEKRKKAEELKLKCITKVTDELDAMTSQVKTDLIAFRNCFKLLIPNVNDFFIPFDDDLIVTNVECDNTLEDAFEEKFERSNSEEIYQNDDIKCKPPSTLFGSEYARTSGLLKGTTVEIDLRAIKRVQTNNDNESVIENLKELVCTLSKQWLPRVNKLQKQMTQYSEGNADLVKQLLAMKNSLKSAINSFTSVTIVPLLLDAPVKISGAIASTTALTDPNNASDSESDNDFIEVDDSDPRVASAMQSEAHVLGISTKSNTAFSSWLTDSGAGTSASAGSNLNGVVTGVVNNDNESSYSDENVSKCKSNLSTLSTLNAKHKYDGSEDTKSTSSTTINRYFSFALHIV